MARVSRSRMILSACGTQHTVVRIAPDAPTASTSGEAMIVVPLRIKETLSATQCDADDSNSRAPRVAVIATSRLNRRLIKTLHTRRESRLFHDKRLGSHRACLRYRPDQGH